MLNYVITVAISVIFVPHYLSIFWEPLRTTPWDVIVGIVFTWLLVGLNIVGIKEAARLNVFLAVLDFATQLLLVALGFFLIFPPDVIAANIHWGVAPTWSSFALAIPVAMIAYTGIETVSNLAEEARDPLRSIPRAISWVAIAVFAIYFTLPWIALSAMPVDEEGGKYVTPLGQNPPDGFKNDPVLGLVKNLGLHGSVLSAAEGLCRHPRVDDPLHRHERWCDRRLADHVLDGYVTGSCRRSSGRLHPRLKTPWLSLIVFAGIAPTLFLLSGQVDFLGRMYAFGAMLSFTIAHVSVTALRVRQARTRSCRGARGRTSASAASTGRSSRSSAASAPGSPGSSSSCRTRRRATPALAGSSSASSSTRSTAGVSAAAAETVRAPVVIVRRARSSTGTSSCRSRRAIRRTRPWTSPAASRAERGARSSR